MWKQKEHHLQTDGRLCCSIHITSCKLKQYKLQCELLECLCTVAHLWHRLPRLKGFWSRSHIILQHIQTPEVSCTIGNTLAGSCNQS